jgi:hypothetical protein
MKKILVILMISILSLIGCKPSPKILEEKTGNGIKLIFKPPRSTSSGSILNIIPTDPEISFEKNETIDLIQFLSIRFPNKEIEATIDSQISFVDCGDGLENISCPVCGKEIPMDYWQEVMDKAHQKNFSDLKIQMPCCGKFAQLNNLKYNQDCGFSKFILTVNDPNNSGLNETELLNELEKISKSKFKIIHAHY